MVYVYGVMVNGRCEWFVGMGKWCNLSISW